MRHHASPGASTARHLTVTAIVLGAAAFLPTRGAAQTLVGRVLEDGRNTPVSGAVISLVDRDDKRRAQTMSDSLGRFRLAPPEAGEYVVVVEGLGYETSRSPLLAIKDEATTVSVELMVTPLPIGLEGLEVSVEAEAKDMLGNFGVTPARLGNRWIDRSAIDKMATPGLVKDLLRWQNIAGVSVDEYDAVAADGKLCVRFRRSERACAIVVLDGSVISMEQGFLLNADNIEAIALLAPTDATTFYGTEGGGGAVLIWTRQGRH